MNELNPAALGSTGRLGSQQLDSRTSQQLLIRSYIRCRQTDVMYSNARLFDEFGYGRIGSGRLEELDPTLTTGNQRHSHTFGLDLFDRLDLQP